MDGYCPGEKMVNIVMVAMGKKKELRSIRRPSFQDWLVDRV